MISGSSKWLIYPFAAVAVAAATAAYGATTVHLGVFVPAWFLAGAAISTALFLLAGNARAAERARRRVAQAHQQSSRRAHANEQTVVLPSHAQARWGERVTQTTATAADWVRDRAVMDLMKDRTNDWENSGGFRV